jgi:hypothetical protein
MSVSFLTGRLLGLLGTLVICATLWAPIAAPYQTTVALQALDRAVGFDHEGR